DGTQQGGGISQTFLAPTAGLYSFAAAIAAQDDADGEINTNAGTFSLLVDGIPVAVTGLGAFSSPFQILRGSVGGSVVLTSGAHTLALLITRPFSALGPQTPDQYLDNISVDGPPVAAVPEPGSLVLLSAGLVALIRRRR